MKLRAALSTFLYCFGYTQILDSFGQSSSSGIAVSFLFIYWIPVSAICLKLHVHSHNLSPNQGLQLHRQMEPLEALGGNVVCNAISHSEHEPSNKHVKVTTLVVQKDRPHDGVHGAPQGENGRTPTRDDLLRLRNKRIRVQVNTQNPGPQRRVDPNDT